MQKHYRACDLVWRGGGGEVVVVVEENGVQLCVEIHLFRDKAPPKSLLYHYSIESMEREPFWTPRPIPSVYSGSGGGVIVMSSSFLSINDPTLPPQ